MHTDTGHSVGSGAFAMNPDGTINQALWNDFADRGLHELAVRSKALAKAYYGEAPGHSYWEGGSTGGRQGLKMVQAHPRDYDGLIVNYPAINWTKFITAELYPQIVYQRDLGGVPLTSAQQSLMGNAAIGVCGNVGGLNLGYILDPSACTYDPRKDANVLCAGAAGIGVTGINATPACVNLAQATAMNKIWYGQTDDGSAPDPTVDNGWALEPMGLQRWYGLSRGTNPSGLAGNSPFSIATDQVALELQNPRDSHSIVHQCDQQWHERMDGVELYPAVIRLLHGHLASTGVRIHQYRRSEPVGVRTCRWKGHHVARAR